MKPETMGDEVTQKGKSGLWDLTQTYVPITQLFAILAGVVGAAMAYQDSRYRDDVADQRMARIENELRSLGDSLDQAVHSRWKFHDMRLWVELLAARNPNIDVPEPKTGE